MIFACPLWLKASGCPNASHSALFFFSAAWNLKKPTKYRSVHQPSAAPASVGRHPNCSSNSNKSRRYRRPNNAPSRACSTRCSPRISNRQSPRPTSTRPAFAGLVLVARSVLIQTLMFSDPDIGFPLSAKNSGSPCCAIVSVISTP